ncbi:MAG TPA: effector-associated domain EAD1-containing protein [Chloroflexia bacterium]|jgi:hypothetical protein
MVKRPASNKQLRTTLSILVDDPLTIRVIAIDAGLQPAAIDFEDPVENIWQSVLDEASAQDLLIELLKKVRHFFPDNAELKLLDTLVVSRGVCDVS